ncbi:4Fe-4S binding protein [Shinella kummerowiae]|jgi:NosR/NirI family nitrous oxide reductase transcriptional regulator|uniref:4Fe-4S binding protein n=1 Tax=Shinella kummerowiae TaxID=417745 RepID=UPI0021B506C5|nr:4Fe-4S binding protein [Shinella kummerowiae]MCT7664054.1 4Fe-4S binding protein [Shinella kummerowiae]
MRRRFALLSFLVFSLLACAGMAGAAPLDRDALAGLIVPPYALGEPVNEKGVWTLLNSGGAEAGYVFETGPLAPLPGFSGAPINMLVTIDRDGRFLDVRLIAHNEPIFVSGLGEAPLRAFLEQYRGHSIREALVVGTPYGEAGGGSDLVYLDGVTKATASVRIAHESILAATLAVAREKMQGVASGPPVHPDPSIDETFDWAELVKRGLARNLKVTNAELDDGFKTTIWARDDPEAADDPQGLFLDLWVVDIGPPSIARAVLSEESFADLQRLLRVSPDDEPMLIIDGGRHGLVSADFVRNTAPDRLAAVQDGLPVALRDADMMVETRRDVPQGTTMVLRIDRRLGFDPTRDWILSAQAVRAHGMLKPEMGSVHFPLDLKADPAFFLRPQTSKALPPWQAAIVDRKWDVAGLGILLAGLIGAVGPGMHRLAAPTLLRPARLAFLGLMIGFVGWWGQGQLSIVTPLAALRAANSGGSLAVLLYDPFSLMVWGAAILGFVLWGRGLFCGWLCPFGAMQEFAHHAGRLLRLPQWNPSPIWDRRLKAGAWISLAGLVAVTFLAPEKIETAAEIEPFKTAVTTLFQREWYYVAYAVFWLLLAATTFKGFCRYVCPLGAVMALGGLLRTRSWIPRRAECGSPCQLCRVRCPYGAIRKTGEIAYSECFQCLDCVSIHDDAQQCVPLVLAQRKRPPIQALAKVEASA